MTLRKILVFNRVALEIEVYCTIMQWDNNFSPLARSQSVTLTVLRGIRVSMAFFGQINGYYPLRGYFTIISSVFGCITYTSIAIAMKLKVVN